ncbi:geranylgeranyltransferase type I alpha subunit-like protein [Chaetomium sp. MPI-SDFR-AT-0129]|nr:geranylgeranyltransferase type I alpha subunit-like protein [Chaetomium sp. MPI-SDFR-AT-0129]
MAAELKKELYGGGVGGEDGKLSTDPEWADVEPVVLQEPEGALAAIAYPDDYAEAMAYLRAVMQAKEHSPRCLRLTEHIIEMNPAHYTVWLYRAANVFALNLPIPDEITWLNEVALQNLKNYQIWHHRHLLVENYHPLIASDPAAISAFAASERAFIAQMLSEDTKNYHVWSYRSYVVSKLGLFDDADELAAIEGLIDKDVRNNSAWSHRFFLVFSNPAYATPGAAATAPDPGVPAEVVDREIEYVTGKIRLAPQNQSGWNYLRGVLVKGGRKLASVEGFVSEFVIRLGEERSEGGKEGGGEEGEGEDVLSTHALDLLAEIYAEKGEKEKADLSLRRLGQKWDRIRVGYWEWRRKCLEVGA